MNINWMAAYTYGMSKDLTMAFVIPSNNYEVNPAINPDNPQLSLSNFDLRHLLVLLSRTKLELDYNTTTLSFSIQVKAEAHILLFMHQAQILLAMRQNTNLLYIQRRRTAKFCRYKRCNPVLQ